MGELGASVLKVIGTGIRFLLKPFIKLLFFTGLIVPAALWFLTDFVPIVPAFLPNYQWLWYVAWGLCLVFLSQNIIRIFKPDFAYLRLVRGTSQGRGERKATNPKAPAELTVSTPQGVVFGKQHGSFVVKPETVDGHFLVIGGQGSGKSSCIAIPSAMSWHERIFAIDIKGELYEESKHKRPNVKRFAPLEADSPGYDPYYLLARSRNPAQDAREIALAIIPTPKDVKEPFWVESAQNVFTGAMLHAHGLGLSFIDTITMIQTTPIEELVNEIHQSDTEVARYYVNQLVGMDIKTLAGITSELANKIMVFATDPDIKACFSKSYTFSPADLESGTDIFIHIPEHLLEQWKGIVTLIVNQFLKHFERRPDKDAIPVLFLLDEFPRLGKVEAILSGLATLRSKRVVIGILIQSLAQLDKEYGQDSRKIIADNCQYKAVLGASDKDTQEYFSRLVGTYDRSKTSQNANFEQYTKLGRGTGISKTTEEKPIIKPEHFGTLKDIVMITPFGFFRLDKAPYFKDKAFAK